MNRAERRRLEKQGYSPNNIMEQYRKEAFDAGYANGMHDCLNIVFYMTAYTIQYKLDYGREDLQYIMKAIFNNIDAYKTGHLTPEDFETIVMDMRNTYGVKLD